MRAGIRKTQMPLAGIARESTNWKSGAGWIDCALDDLADAN
jgi:hypothetical protein